jgi:hypothetical protein
VFIAINGQGEKNMNTSRSIIAALVAGGALLTGSTAFAQVDNGMIQGYAPQQGYEQRHMVSTAVVISLGWHDDRYWDGHRYWSHDEWMHHHPRDPGLRHGDYHHD